MTLERGVLKVRLYKTKRPMIQVEVPGQTRPLSPPKTEVSRTIVDRAKDLNGCEVEFERVKGQPKKVRLVGEEFVAASSARGQHRQGGTKGRKKDGSEGHVRSNQEVWFYNPYSFVPIPKREGKDPDLGDHYPVSHEAFDQERYTGRLVVQMVVETPLLIMTIVEETPDGHKSYAVCQGTDGLPRIPASSVRGMLRAAYEAITNSRFGRFSRRQHGERLQYREGRERKRFNAAPWELLDKSLKPAVSITELSPADRVFGWVRGDSGSSQRPKQGSKQRQPHASRGLIRVGQVRCDGSSKQPSEVWEAGVPLAVLSTPKPEQAKFYVAGKNGLAQKRGLSKSEAGYSRKKVLRGRKVYPHHKGLPSSHWDNPHEDRTCQGKPGSVGCSEGGPKHYQEYRRPKTRDKYKREQRDNQNSSILGWIKPGARFSFELHAKNLTDVELGAILWLLDLPNGHFLRLGGGRPLGFGSVRLSLVTSSIRSYEDLRARYSAWCTDVPFTSAQKELREAAQKSFMKSVCRAYASTESGEDNGFEDVSFIKAFLLACTGFDSGLPTHYPRTTKDPKPEGESFNWFRENEREGARYTLGNLQYDPDGEKLGPSLPLLEESKERGGKAGRAQNRRRD